MWGISGWSMVFDSNTPPVYRGKTSGRLWHVDAWLLCLLACKNTIKITSFFIVFSALLLIFQIADCSESVFLYAILRGKV